MKSTQLASVLALWLAFHGHSAAADRFWANTGTGTWTVSSNWAGSLMPATGDEAYIENGGTAVFPIDGSANTYQTFVGNSGTGTLRVEGGSLRAQFSVIGGAGTGTLELIGGTFFGTHSYLAFESGSSGTANVSGGNWNLSSDIHIGNAGTGYLSITGGQISNRSGYIGAQAGSSGIVDVSGGEWHNNFSLYVGDSGTGYLNVKGGTVSGSITAGNEPGSFGKVMVSNGTLNHGGFSIGESGGEGEFVLTGGAVSGQFASIGTGIGSKGTATVTGGTWTMENDLGVGQGTLTISGGQVSNDRGYVGGSSSRKGVVTVSGGTWENRDELNVGYGGSGVLTISGGGKVTIEDGNGDLQLADVFNDGVLNIGGGQTAGILLAARVRGGLNSGFSPASVNFGQIDTFSFAPRLTDFLSINQTGNGTTILTGNNTYTGNTTLKAGALRLGSANAIPATVNNLIFFEGGTLQYSAANVRDYSGQFSKSTNQAYRVDTNGQSVIFASVLGSAGGSLTKLGLGILTLTANNTYTGTTTVAGGTLLLNGNGSIASSSAIHIAVGATLDVSNVLTLDTYTIGPAQSLGGGGIVNVGGKTLAVVGTLEPGVDSFGVSATFTVIGSLLLGDDSEIHLNIYGSGDYDAVKVENILDYDGKLVLNVEGPLGNGTNNLFSFLSPSTGNWDAVELTGNYQGALAYLDGLWKGSFDGAAFTFDGNTGTLSYAAIPEPGTWALITLGFAIVGLSTGKIRKRKADCP